MNNDQILSLLKISDGLSDREITNTLFGQNKPQKIVSQACRTLADNKIVIRRKRPDNIIGNYLADKVPDDLRQKAQEMGRMWAESRDRPRLTAAVKGYWNQLIQEWINDPDMPLVVRKGGIRGSEVSHRDSGRKIIIADNSPAQWVFTCALDGKTYNIETLKENICHKVPFAFATKKSEKPQMEYRGTVISCGVDLNKRGWKLCHIKSVGLRDKTPVEDISIERLKKHMRLLLNPNNHFVVPKEWWGFGEIPEVIEEVRKFEEDEMPDDIQHNTLQYTCAPDGNSNGRVS